jgi:hypothetical protein
MTTPQRFALIAIVEIDHALLCHAILDLSTDDG